MEFVRPASTPPAGPGETSLRRFRGTLPITARYGPQPAKLSPQQRSCGSNSRKSTGQVHRLARSARRPTSFDAGKLPSVRPNWHVKTLRKPHRLPERRLGHPSHNIWPQYGWHDRVEYSGKPSHPSPRNLYYTMKFVLHNSEFCSTILVWVWGKSADRHEIDPENGIHAMLNALHEEILEPRGPNPIPPTLYIGPPRQMGDPCSK